MHIALSYLEAKETWVLTINGLRDRGKKEVLDKRGNLNIEQEPPRRTPYMLLQLIMMGKVAGKRCIGRNRKSWLRNIREWTGIASADQLFSLAREKENYQKLTANVH
ncbi:jg20849 [Pararge aegeria aegeria]|uniref:Jg20849 protein n=1 Tax=Pararge aegeria aegeria TaxID=348720 RepID=A0A8S4R3P9_9NEOP|nr:jg20849 [Pararge aegeria aegeria]